MRRFIVLASVLVLFFFPVFPAFSESSSDQIVMYRLKEGGIKEIRDDFSIGGKIYADFIFLPNEKETSVQFRWINPLNKKEQTYFELVKSAMPPQKKIIICWLLLQPSFPDKIIGSKFFGRWRLEVWVNRRRVAEKIFSIGN
jgi:hypothetical protein